MDCLTNCDLIYLYALGITIPLMFGYFEGITVKDFFHCTVKPVLSSHSKKDHKFVFKTDYHLMQANSIAECSMRAFCNTFDLH